MPKFIRINQQFFDNWNPEMAYVLGFFSADGNLAVNPRGSRYLQFTSTDKDVLVKIRRVMGSGHRLRGYKRREGRKKVFRIQIGSKYMFERLTVLGLTVNKSLTLKFPPVPQHCLSHFVRGYFDGDGFVVRYRYVRKNRNNRIQTYVQSGFTCGSKVFLTKLFSDLKLNRVIVGGSLVPRKSCWDLRFATKDTVQLCKWMYKDHNDLYLDRKYQVYKNILGDVV